MFDLVSTRSQFKMLGLDLTQFLYLSFQAAVCEKAFSLVAIGVPENARTPLRLIHHNASCHRPLFARPRNSYNRRLRYFEVIFSPICTSIHLSSLPRCQCYSVVASLARQKNNFSNTQFSAQHIPLTQLCSTVDVRKQLVTS